MAILAGKPDLAAGEEIVKATRMGRVAKAKQDAGRDAGGGEPAPQQGKRRDADAAPYEDCARSAGGERVRRREGVAERAVDPNALTGRQRAEAIRPRPDTLDQEFEPYPTGFSSAGLLLSCFFPAAFALTGAQRE